jgi:hypothetical protein
MDADGACWTVPNSEVRMTFNWTMGRRKPEAAEIRTRAAAAAPGLFPEQLNDRRDRSRLHDREEE